MSFTFSDGDLFISHVYERSRTNFAHTRANFAHTHAK